MNLIIRRLNPAFSICKLQDFSKVDLSRPFHFAARTDEECSLVCPTADVPKNTIVCDDGWRAFRIEGTLDFSLIGILARISALLAQREIGIFVVSTYNTDYILTKAENFDQAIDALAQSGYTVL